jgi:transglutaminase-like putative cysteine protease
MVKPSNHCFGYYDIYGIGPDSGSELGRVCKPVPLLIILSGILIASVTLGVMAKLHPIIVAANAVPLFHSFLWFESNVRHYRGWRIGLGFVELILCSALTTEFYLPFAIVCFVILGSVALSCVYLEYELLTNAPELLKQPLPKRFIRTNIWIAVVTFMTSLVIFPLLPRTRATFGNRFNETQINYTERVNIGEWRSLISKQKGSVALRLYPRTDIELNNEIFPGLLKGRVLEIFDGKSWKPSAEEYLRLSKSFHSISSAESGKAILVDVIREPMQSPVFPAPYGTREVRTQQGDNSVITRGLSTGEWLDYNSVDQRAYYSFTLIPNSLAYLAKRNEIDPPMRYHLYVPEKIKTNRMNKLAEDLFKGSSSNRDKIYRVNAFLKGPDFSATIDYENNAILEASKKTRLTPLEQFLFITKEGHCEFFSTAAAVLLRMAKVPTRLVSGFRTSKQTSGGVLLVNTTDAHAWVEAWTPETGWYPIDPTPRSLSLFSLGETLSNTYDLMNAYWYKYIVTYGENQTSFKFSNFTKAAWQSIRDRFKISQEHMLPAVLFALLSVAILGGAAYFIIWTWFPWVLSIRWRVREGPFELRKERIKMENWIFKTLKSEIISRDDAQVIHFEKLEPKLISKLSPEKQKQLGEWVKHYRTIRFGKITSNLKVEIHSLRDKFRNISH